MHDFREPLQDSRSTPMPSGSSRYLLVSLHPGRVDPCRPDLQGVEHFVYVMRWWSCRFEPRSTAPSRPSSDSPFLSTRVAAVLRVIFRWQSVAPVSANCVHWPACLVSSDGTSLDELSVTLGFPRRFGSARRGDADEVVYRPPEAGKSRRRGSRCPGRDLPYLMEGPGPSRVPRLRNRAPSCSDPVRGSRFERVSPGWMPSDRRSRSSDRPSFARPKGSAAIGRAASPIGMQGAIKSMSMDPQRRLAVS